MFVEKVTVVILKFSDMTITTEQIISSEPPGTLNEYCTYSSCTPNNFKTF